MRTNRNRRRDLAGDRRRNQNGVKNSRDEIEAPDSREGNQRAGVRDDDGHSEFLDRAKFALQLVTLKLEVWDAPLRGVSNELLAFLAEQLRRASAGDLPLSVELEDNQLPSRLLGGSLELFEEVYEIPIKFDGCDFHACLY